MSGRPRILFVCGRNRWRSPTASRVYSNDDRIEVKSAGVSSKSHRQISGRDLEWADLVLVMEQRHKTRLLGDFRHLVLPPIEVLEIPDQYEFMDSELVSLIGDGTDFYLERRFGMRPLA